MMNISLKSLSFLSLLTAIVCVFSDISFAETAPQKDTSFRFHGPYSHEQVSYILVELNGSERIDRPTVILLGGSEGGYGMLRSPLLRDLLDQDINVISMAYFGVDGTPKTMSEINLDHLAEAIELSVKQIESSSLCYGVIGVSKGSEAALLLATYKELADAYVAVVPTHVVWQASNVTLARKSSWVLNDEPLPFVRYPWLSKATIDGVLDTNKTLALHEKAIEKAGDLEQYAIPVEQASVPILLQSALNDHVWPSHAMSMELMQRARDYEVTGDIIHTEYADDHFLLSRSDVRAEALTFLKKNLSAACSKSLR